MKITIFNFFENNTLYELVNEVILKKSNDVNASDAKIKKLFQDVIVNSEKASIGQYLCHVVVHIGKYLFVASYRENFKQALIDIQEKIKSLAKKKIPNKQPTPKKGSVADLRTLFIVKEPPKRELTRPLKEPTVDFTKPENITEFNRELEEIIARLEGRVGPKEANQKASDEQIAAAIEVMKRNDQYSPNEFLDLVHKMEEASVRKMIQELKSNAEKRKLSDIDLLWTMIAGCEVKESNFEKFKTCIGNIFNAFSEEQLKASNLSPKFRNVITHNLKPKAIAEVMNKSQLKIIASNLDTADVLSDILKYIPSDDHFFFGKIAAVLPHATEPLRGTLNIIFRSFPPLEEEKRNINLITNLESLFKHYIKINEASKAELKAKSASTRAPAKRHDSPIVQYKKYHPPSTPAVESRWTEVELSEFIAELQSIQVDDHVVYLKKKFDSMDRISLIKFVERSTGTWVENLDRLWRVDKDFTGEGNQLSARNERMRIVFSHLTDEQLERASANADFLKLLTYTLDGIDGIAAEVFSAEQLALIASPTQDLNPLIYRQKHEALVKVIIKLPKENFESKIRAILPYISPRLAEGLKEVIEFRAIEFPKGVKEELLSLIKNKMENMIV